MEEADECTGRAAALFAAYGGAPWEQHLRSWALMAADDIAVCLLNAKVSNGLTGYRV